MKPSITLHLSCLLLLALIAFSAPVTAFVEEKVSTALLPTKVDGSKVTVTSDIRLDFDIGALPSKAKVVAARLVLVANKPTPSPQTISAHTVPPSGTTGDPVLFDEITVHPNEPRSEWIAYSDSVTAIEAYHKTGKKFSLVLSTTKGTDGVLWVSNNVDTHSQRPRLILEYTLAGRPALTESNGLPAVQSPRAFLPNVTPSAAASHRVPAQEVSVHSQSPAFFNDQVYVLAGTGSQKHLSVLSPLGKTAPTDIPVTAPGDHLAVSDPGWLYLVGNDRIIVFDLNSDPPLETKNVPGTQLGIPDLNPELPPTAGPDGSLYFVSSQQLHALNPGLETLWSFKLTDKKTSRVTVGPSGKFVYLTVLGKGLIAVNAQTGETFTSISGDGQTLLKDTNNITFHAPVVLRTTDGSERIYAGANSATGGVLTCFENPLAVEDPDGGEIVQAMIGDGKPWLFKGRFSQAILAPGSVTAGSDADSPKRVKLYCVEVTGTEGKLSAIDWFDGTRPPAPGAGIGNAAFLLDGGNLAVDQKQSVFVWSGAPGADSIHGFNSSLKPVPIKVDGLASESRLFFGTDGTLYAGKAKDALRAIVPLYHLAGQPTNIVSPNHLQVDGRAGGIVTLSAHGSVLLGNGFTVTKDTTLKIKNLKTP